MSSNESKQEKPEKSQKSDQNHWSRWIGLLLIFTAILLILEKPGIFPFPKGNDTPSPFSSVIQKDLKLLKKDKKLRRIFAKVSEVQVKPMSKVAQKWLNKNHFPLRMNYKGNLRAEISIDHYKEGNKLFAIVEYHFVDLTTKNTYWEFARTLRLK